MEFNEKKIVFMGTPQFASHILDGLCKAGYHIVAVVTQPDKQFGRKKLLKPSEVKERRSNWAFPS